MPSTHCSLHVHIVFSTKNREPFISPDWRGELHSVMGGIVRNLEGHSIIVGGMGDHVHLLVGLRPKHCLSDFVRELKIGSNKWVKEKIGIPKFSWQEGFGVFSVSPSHLENVVRYIAHQEEHHRKKSFHEEYLDFLKKSGVEFDERYLW